MFENLPSAYTHEPEPTEPFLDFLLAQPEIRDANTTTTELYFDLDETMFRRTERAMHDVTGSWRPDMPQTLRGLKERGFVLHILSSAALSYIHGALDIYQQQFGEDARGLFATTLTTWDYDYFGTGNKYVALPEVANQVQAAGKRAVFIDDARLRFDPKEYNTTVFDYVEVPLPMQYRATPNTTYTAPLDLARDARPIDTE